MPLWERLARSTDKELREAKKRAIALSGWVAPWQTKIRRYYNNLNSRPEVGSENYEHWLQTKCHYRLICRQPWLPGKNGQFVRVVHLRGGLNSDYMQWAIAGLKRRNRIAEFKFHCVEQCFLNQFLKFKNFDFLNIENVHIYT